MNPCRLEKDFFQNKLVRPKIFGEPGPSPVFPFSRRIIPSPIFNSELRFNDLSAYRLLRSWSISYRLSRAY